MNTRSITAAAAAFAALLCASVAPGELKVAFQPVYTNRKFVRPVALAIPDDGTRRLFLVQQRGQVLILPADRANGSEYKKFLDLSDRKMEEKDFEEGLLGMAFHPRYRTNRKFYIYYSRQDPKRTVLSEMQASKGNPDRADPSTERVLMEIPQPFWNHNSGNLLFAPDGMLFVSVGDGGKRDDLRRLAQNLWALNGKILRIDVDRRQGARAYGIPPDNPFVKKDSGIRPEIYAYGLRNPWGLHIDRKTGIFWCADVGQNIWEEVNHIKSGGNYGWSYREGLVKFQRRHDAPPKDAVFVDPIQVYPHRLGISITGGVVYRGKAVPALRGHYLYGDWARGTVWALRYDAAAGKVTANHQIYKRPKRQQHFQPTAFVKDLDGEVLVLSWKGHIFQLVSTGGN